MQATARRAARAMLSLRVRDPPWRSRRGPLRERHRENSRFADALFDFAEPCRLDQLIHLGLGAAAHDPCLALAVTGECARDKFELRMPRLVRVNKISACRYGCGEARERTAH